MGKSVHSHIRHGFSILTTSNAIRSTIVTSDAYSTLAYAAEDSLAPNSSIPSWDEIEQTYGTIQGAASDTVPEPTSLQGAIDYSNNALLRSVEQWSFTYVNSSGLFDTITLSNLQKYARNVTLRDGWCGFAQAAIDKGVQIHVISLNWSPSWIRLVLEEASDCPEVVGNIATYCSEILPSGVLPSNPLNHAEPLFAGGDKTKLMQRILKRIPAESKERVAFFSDGDADLQPLWESPTTVGFAAGLDGSAFEAFEQYNVSVWPASQGWKGETGTAGSNSSIYSFEDWSDVQQLLWG